MGSRVLEFPVATDGTLLVEVDDPQVLNPGVLLLRCEFGIKGFSGLS